MAAAGARRRARTAGGAAALVLGLVVAAPARASDSCHVGILARGTDGLRGLDPVERVAKTAAAFEEACRDFGKVSETAGDIAVVSPERRRALDLALGARGDGWRELCPSGARVLRDAVRMTHRDGRAHVWDACGLDEQPALAGITREEWVDHLEGMLILPLEAAVVLREANIDRDLAEIVVRGLVGLAPRAPEPAVADADPAAGGETGSDPGSSEGPAVPDGGDGGGDGSDGDLPSLDEVLGGGTAAPAPAPAPAPVPVPAPAPAPAPRPAPKAHPAPKPAPEPVAEAPGSPGPPPAGARARPGGKRVPPVERARFKPGGKAKPKWSSEALAAGGTCVVRIRVGANGKMQKITFLECPDPLKNDVHMAAERSKYIPANDGEYPVPGAFRTKWAVGSPESE